MGVTVLDNRDRIIERSIVNDNNFSLHALTRGNGIEASAYDVGTVEGDNANGDVQFMLRQ